MTDHATDPAALRAAIRAERVALAELLAGLPEGSWDAPSLCAGWRVREVVAHMTMPFRYSTPRFLFELLKDRGKFKRMADRCARVSATRPIPDLLAALRDNVDHPWKPPGGGHESALVHDVIHGLDITEALGLDRDVPEDRMRRVLAVVERPRTLRAFGADLSGVELRADDIDWTYGSGVLVQGPARCLALVLCGRRVPAGRLHGEAGTRFAPV
jgi:uncharacterized protein (TIGR03083 family)